MERVVAVLENASSPDISKRKPAEEQLKLFEQQNLAQYLILLCQVLASDRVPPQLRQLAGLNLKNTMTSKDDKQREILAKRWLAVPDDIRSKIRVMVLGILGASDKAARRTAAMIVARIASVEIPEGKWPDLVDNLLKNIRQRQHEHLRTACFDALGFVCEECADYLTDKSDPILTAIASGMTPDEKNNEIKLAATTALANSLQFVKKNMESEKHRKMIMQMVFQSLRCPDVQVRQAAFMCLVAIADLYYEYLAAYIDPIFLLTSAAIHKEAEEVQLQAIEFWSTVCDSESAIKDEEPASGAPPKTLHNFVASALDKKIMVPLLECMTKQSPELDDRSWNTAQAAGVCISLMAQVAGQKCVQHVLPFVSANITSGEWRLRDAATLSFGAILEGPSPAQLKPLVTRALPTVVQHMNDPHPIVKDSAAWTVGKICDILPEVITDAVLPKLVLQLIKSLQDKPHIAYNVCWAINNLAEHNQPAEGAKTSRMSQFFERLVGSLLAVTQRADSHQANLMSSAYEAINTLILKAAEDVNSIIHKLLPVLMSRLQQIRGGGGGEEGQRRTEAQGLLCAALQAVIQKLPDDAILPHADNLMRLFLTVLTSNAGTSVLEEALMAIGGLANRTGQKFNKYMGPFVPILLKGLTAVRETRLVGTAAGVLTDVARAVGPLLIPFSDQIMKTLLGLLQHKELDRNVKPTIIASLSDIALAIGGHYERYLKPSMQMVIQASQTRFDRQQLEEGDNSDFLNSLRESVFDAYTGILHGLGGDNKKAHLLVPFLQAIVMFIDLVASDENREDELLKQACGLIGDLVTEFPQIKQPLLSRGGVQRLVNEATHSDSDPINKAGVWAKEQLGMPG